MTYIIKCINCVLFYCHVKNWFKSIINIKANNVLRHVTHLFDIRDCCLIFWHTQDHKFSEVNNKQITDPTNDNELLGVKNLLNWVQCKTITAAHFFTSIVLWKRRYNFSSLLLQASIIILTWHINFSRLFSYWTAHTWSSICCNC